MADRLCDRLQSGKGGFDSLSWLASERFGLSNNRFAGIGKVTIHAFSCLIAYLIKYAMCRFGGDATFADGDDM